ncbi:hypothetical protein B296_00038984 [Ensete ventricosum]|uniref:Uncharacterized protein n=1 Tax=Ensete ventricosum TaxID=4639 RepID=A0A426X5G8_ENSVE|nr:hypothetical protein B296_00038984 [Ensete ventricosum]
MGSHRKFARRFVEGIGKLAGNVKGDCRKEDRQTCRKIVRGCRSMRETRAVTSSFRWVNCPGRRVNRLYSDFSNTVRFWL